MTWTCRPLHGLRVRGLSRGRGPQREMAKTDSKASMPRPTCAGAPVGRGGRRDEGRRRVPYCGHI
eukprot:scaffold36_cov397-Prasinococcus_capsulatus_cf.AAC.1